MYGISYIIGLCYVVFHTVKRAIMSHIRWFSSFLLMLLCGFASGAFVQSSGTERLLAETRTSLEARKQGFDAELAKHRVLVALLAEDAFVQAAVGASDKAQIALSERLAHLRGVTDATVLYLLDAQGTAVSSSNWDQPDHFTGENYGFRAYFKDALTRGKGTEFALGTVSHRPGLYLSQRLDNGQGVIVVKIEFDAMEAAWAVSALPTRIVNAQGEIQLTSRPAERFTPVQPDAQDLTAPLAVDGWALRVTPLRAGLLLASLSAAAAGFLAAGVLSLAIRRGLAARARLDDAARRSAELEDAVQSRTSALRAEMDERKRTESRLAAMQADLVQANKLATLGQITAGVAHELNQPLAALRLMAENARSLLPPRAKPELRESVEGIWRMQERIGKITTELRGFARKSTSAPSAVSLDQVIDASLQLTSSRQRGAGARVIRPVFGLTVLADPLRLEQVLVNLIQNAQDALRGYKGGEIRLSAEESAREITLSISDNGPGLAPDLPLFTPFSSSKSDGLGLGLVIAQSIAREMGGELSAEAPSALGATFRLRLPRAQP